jgi:hypothetical protein
MVLISMRRIMKRVIFVALVCLAFGASGSAHAQSTGLRPERFIALPWTWSAAQTFSAGLTGVGGSYTAITSLGVRDTSAAFDLTLAATSSVALTAGRTLTFDVANGNRTVKLVSNLTITTDPGAVTGALKSNGSGTFSQAACADLSTACVTGTGTSNTVAKWSSSSGLGNSTIGDAGSGVTVGSPTGGAQGAGTLNATALYINGSAVGAAGVSSLGTSTPGVVLAGTGSGPYTGTVTVNLSALARTQAGGAILSTDANSVVLNSSGAMTIANATGGLGDGFATNIITGSTAATLTPTTATINGNATEPMGINEGLSLVSKGGQYYSVRGVPEPVASSVLVASSGRVQTWQAGTTSQLVRGDGSLGTLGTAASVATGTSGATIGLLNGSNTYSGLDTFSGGVLTPPVADITATANIDPTTAFGVCGGSIAYNSSSAGTLSVLSTWPAGCNVLLTNEGTGLATISGSTGTVHTACATGGGTAATARAQYSGLWIKARSTGVVTIGGDCS